MADVLRAKDFASDQDIRWCPGCGDFAILKQTQMVLAKIGADPAKTVFISGIGCSSRFPYYMNTYGMHSIHGRAAAIASGLRLTREDLDIWIISGDGDSLSIGGNHLIHLLRRDLNVNLLLFNNEIYGLTKGQFSPSSKHKLKTKSSPFGTKEKPFNTLSLSFGAGATFIARSLDREAKHLQEVLERAHGHEGSSLLEVYQNCHIFNDGAFLSYTDKSAQKINALFLRNNEPLIFGAENELAIKLEGLTPKVVNRTDYSDDELWVHDETDKVKASIICNVMDADPNFPRFFGVVFASPDNSRERVNETFPVQSSYINKLIRGERTWTV